MEIFPETFKLLNIIFALPVGTVKRTFSQLKSSRHNFVIELVM